MPQRDIIEAVKGGVIHLPHAANHRFRAAAPDLLSVHGDVLMCSEDVALCEIDFLRGKQLPHGGIIIVNAVILQHLCGKRREDVRHQPKGYRPVPVGKRYVRKLPGKHAADVDILLCQQSAAKGQPLPGVMVSGGQQDWDSQPCQPGNDVVKQADGVPRRGVPVVDIPRHYNRVRAQLLRQLQEALRPSGLVAVFHQGHAVNGFPEMQVRQV